MPHLIEDIEEEDDANGEDSSVDPDNSSVISDDSDDQLDDSPILTPNLIPTHPIKEQKPQPVRPKDHLLAELWALLDLATVGTHYTSSLKMLQSELIPYSLLPQSKLEFVSVDPARLSLKRLSQNNVSMWTLASCVHQQVTTPSPHLPLTGWSPINGFNFLSTFGLKEGGVI